MTTDDAAVDARALASTLLDLMTDFRRRWHDAAGHDPLPPGMIEIMRVIEKNPGITVAGVAARLGRQVSNVSAQLRELDARALITREKDPSDKRYVTLHATPEAIAVRASLEAALADELRAAMAGLTAGDARTLAKSVPALQHLSALLEPGA